MMAIGVTRSVELMLLTMLTSSVDDAANEEFRTVSTFVCICICIQIQWNRVIKSSDITKPFYKKVILLGQALYILLGFFTLI